MVRCAMMPPMRSVFCLVSVLAVIGLAAGSACAPAENTSSGPAPAEQCSKDSFTALTKGTITFGTDQPAYPPWFIDDDPANGKGFESAVAYAVADKLGYSKESVKWVSVPFNAAIAPGPKTFDGLKGIKLGAQVGTTSYTAAKAIDPGVAVFNNNDDAKAALTNGQIDALVLDLPTAFAVQAELTDGVIVGQLPPTSEKAEQFGIVLDKGSPLTACVSKAVDELGNDGELAKLQKEWLTGAGSAPVLS